MTATVDTTHLKPGAKLAIDGQQVDAAVWLQGGTLAGLLDHGTMKLHFASTRPGEAVCGSFEAISYTFSFALLAGGTQPGLTFNDPRPANRPNHAGTGTPTTGPGIGDVLRQCRPSRPPH